MEVLFWIWVAVTILASSVVYLTLWSTQVLVLSLLLETVVISLLTLCAI